jgi:hypothetical protein
VGINRMPIQSRTITGCSRTIGQYITAIAVLLCSWTPVFAQQGVPLNYPYGQWFTSTGAVCNGCKLYFYAAGTTTPQDTYADANLTTVNANPVVLNSAGRALIFLNSKAYKVILRTSADVEIWTADNIVAVAPPSSVLSKTATYTVTVTDGKDVLIRGDASGGAFTINLYTAVGNPGRIVRLVKIDSSSNAITIDANGLQTINGALTQTLSVQNDAMSLISDGANWLALESNVTNSSRAGRCDCRLTLTSGTEVTTSDVTAAGTIYLTPSGGNQLSTFNGSTWDLDAFTEVSLALTVTSGTNYDVFVYRNGLTPTLELTAWTNDTTRATALTKQDGVYVRTGATSRMYVGTIRASGSNTTEDSTAKRFVWNYYHRVSRPLRKLESTDSWTYNTATYQQANNSTANQVEIVVGLVEDAVTVRVAAWSSGGGTNSNKTSVAIGESAITASANCLRAMASNENIANEFQAHYAFLDVIPEVGYRYYTWLEQSENADTNTWYGDNGGTLGQAGITGMWRS